jgi:hypothetical protein
MFRIQPHRPLQAAFKIAPAFGKNVQVNPHPIRTHFEFAVITRPRRIRLQEHFRYIAIPKLIAASVRIGIVEGKQLAVAALESQVENLQSP